MSATCFPQLMPILILLVKQVLLCPIPHVCVLACHCGLPSAGVMSLGLHRVSVTVQP